jgi:hypothetical protein
MHFAFIEDPPHGNVAMLCADRICANRAAFLRARVDNHPANVVEEVPQVGHDNEPADNGRIA